MVRYLYLKKRRDPKSFIYFILVHIIFLNLFKKSFQGYFDSFIAADRELASSLIEVKDYNNQYLIITTNKNIYTGLDPVLKLHTKANIKDYTYGASFNKTIILCSCLEDSLLSTVNINNDKVGKDENEK